MYKIAQLKKNDLFRIYAFVGESSGITEDNYAKSGLFTKEELNVDVMIVPINIYQDDSILSIKLKWADAIKKIEEMPSFHEMYFYGIDANITDPVILFEKHQKNGFIPKDKYELIIQNLVGQEVEVENEVEFELADLIKEFETEEIHTFFSIGQHSYNVGTVNPFFLKDSEKNRDTISHNSHVLLDYPPLFGNTIYACLADDVITSKNSNIIIANYFPLLSSLGFQSKLKPTDMNKLRTITQTSIDNLVTSTNKVNMLHEVFNKRTSDLKYVSKGIKSIELTLLPDYEMKIPIDVIFKLIHADENKQLIKYNFSAKQDNIYRLFVDKKSTNGEKIPSLPKAQIFKLMKSIGNIKSVCIYSKFESHEFICQFEPNGNITFSIQFDTPLQYDNLEELNMHIRHSVQPINEEILPFFEQNGYKMATFQGINHVNVIIKDMSFQTTVKVEKMLNTTDYYSCVSSVFNIVLIENDANVSMRYKRMGGYNVKDAIRQFVLEYEKNKIHASTTKQNLINSFGISQKEATQVIAEVRDEAEQKQKLNRRQKNSVEKPGFETLVVTDRIARNVTITINGINRLEYLSMIPVYVDSWIRLSQSEHTSDYPIEKINQICLLESKDVYFSDGESESEEESSSSEEEGESSSSSSEEEEAEQTRTSSKSKSNSSKVDSDLGEYKNQYLMDEDSSGGNAKRNKGEGPKVKKSKEPKETQPKETQPKETQPKETQPKETQPKETQPKEKTTTGEDIHNIDGMSLSHPYFFQQRMEDRAKTLFSSIKGDKFKSYSRMCPSSIRRQPVILTKEELDETKKQYPGEYSTPDDVLAYSSNKDDPKNPESFYYVCPRYWCLKTNSIISEKDVKSGKCGKILPPDATKVIPGHYVYEFSAPEEHVDEKGEYIKHYPGFHKNATEGNKCIPCCYKKFTEKQKERRAQCEGIVENPEYDFALEPTSPIEDMPIVAEDNYILGPEKFPLGIGRWGKLPIAIQHFFKDVGAECKVKKNNKNKSSCLLRHGVEKNLNKSFLACIIDALYYAEYNSDKEPIPLLDVSSFIEERLLNAFDLDSFLLFQNGTLYDNFAQKTTKSFSSVDAKYKTTKLYLKSQGEYDVNKQFFMNVLSAYENFCDFLKNEKSYVDYTYLWDLICKPNPMLFKEGLNLLILNIPDSDSTTNVEFICPTNHYSKEVYDSRRRSLILLSRDDMFEPVYEYKDIETKINVQKTFSEYDRYRSPAMHAVITQVVKPLIREHCSPSKLKTYQYKTPDLLEDLIKKINTRRYKIEYQVRNLRGKVVGLLATDPKGTTGFIPCYPTVLNMNLKKEFVYTNDDIWETYSNTLKFLNRWYKIKKTNSLEEEDKKECSPDDNYCKVVDDEVIVGFLTNTNQFIPISDRVPNHIQDSLPQIENNDYLLADNSIAVPANKYDMDRINYSKQIKLENNFYSAFRSAVRILLNDYSNSSIQKQLIQEITGKSEIATMYSDKLDKVVELLKILTKDRIRFIDEVEIDGNDLVASCLSVNDANKCDANPSCFYSKGNCGLNLPRMNLLSPETDNTELYYLRMADEMIRYNRIKTFIFQRKNYLMFETLGYNLRYNEIIILGSLITQQYFETRVPSKQTLNLMNAYDTTNPVNKRKQMELTVDQIKQIYHDDEIEVVPDRLSPLKYISIRNCFPSNSIQIMYPSLANATFQFAKDIIRQTGRAELSSNDIRQKLVELYRNYVDRYKIKIADILIQQGKKTFGSYVKAGSLLVEHMIYTEGYYLTNIDLWLLLDHYQIPAILISHKQLLETGYNLKEFVFYVDINNPFSQKYVFIVSSAIKTEIPPSYGYIELEGRPTISLEEDLKEICQDNILSSISDPISIETYIESFKPILSTKYLKKQQGAIERRVDTPEMVEEQEPEDMEAQPIVINVREEIVVPNLNIEPVSRMKATTKRNKNPKIPKNVHKPRTKKTLPKSEVSV